LIKDMQAIKDVGFDQSKVSLKKWKTDSQNEVHQLGSVFQQLVAQINKQFEQLKQTDVHRRELLADISHDLRTPLASLQGYVETVSLKGDDLSSSERQSYVETALKNARQLKSLIDQIFELAHLDGGQVSLNLETFNLGELLYDVVAKFSLTAQQKNISISITPPYCDVQVYSDIGKLERVLSNLLENALRHTAAQGEIILQVDEVNDNQCQILVKDNGTGIKSEEVAYIFDARYRASNATQKDGKHTGLGLAITKKLLELLQSDIRVKSALGEGTSFSFNLRKVGIS